MTISKTLRLHLTFAFAVSIFTGTMSAHADDYIAPHLVKVSTPRYRPAANSFKPKLGTYEYTVSWQGIPAASCTLTVKEAEGRYQIEAAARTYSGVDLLYRLRYVAQGTLEANSLRPVSLVINHDENSRHKNIDVKFSDPSGNITAVRSKSPDDPEKKVASFDPGNMTLDPIGAAFLARSLPWEVGQSRDLDVFNGKSRYYITLTAVERTSIAFKGEMRKVIVITPRVRNLSTTKPRSKLREAFIYVTDDDQREVLKIVSSVFIGSVTTEMESFVSSEESSSSPLVIAQAANSDQARAQLRAANH
jgi:hypothetical protein